MTKQNQRVGAVLQCKDGIVDFLGYGLYVGDEVPETAMGWIADTLREMKHTNPKIVLDSGKVVWGCECWWGSEEEIKKRISGQTIRHVDIDAVRKAYSSTPNN